MEAWIKLIEFFDKHPVAFVATLVTLGAMLIVFGFPLPKRTQKQTTDGIEVTWSLDGGVSGLARALIDVGKALVKAAEINAQEREASRGAHASELQAIKSENETIRREQGQQNAVLSTLTESVRNIATDLHILVGEVKHLLNKRAHDEAPLQTTDRASVASCTTTPKH